jgi:hypothetical protein
LKRCDRPKKFWFTKAITATSLDVGVLVGVRVGRAVAVASAVGVGV